MLDGWSPIDSRLMWSRPYRFESTFKTSKRVLVCVRAREREREKEEK